MEHQPNWGPGDLMSLLKAPIAGTRVEDKSLLAILSGKSGLRLTMPSGELSKPSTGTGTQKKENPGCGKRHERRHKL